MMSTHRAYKSTPFKAPRRSLKAARTASFTASRNVAAAKRFSRSSSTELKFFDTANAWTFDFTGEVPATGQLNIVPQGVNESERIGRKITIKKIDVRLVISPNAATWVGSALRLLLVQDTQCNGAAATYSGVAGVLESTDVMAFRNLENVNRFVVHKDWMFVLNPTAGVTTSMNLTKKILKFSKEVSIPIEYDSVGTSGALTTTRSNNLFFIARSDNDDDSIAVAGVTRIRYIDG